MSNSGTSIFAGAITVASNATIGSGGGTLSLTGGILKDGTTLTLAGGGVININSGSSAAAVPVPIWIVNGTTANLNVTNSYNGPTSVMGGGNIVLGVNNAIPNNSAVTLGDGSTTGILTMGTLTNAIGSLTFGTSPGTGTVKMAASQPGTAPSAQLSASGAVDLGSGNTLDLTGMGTTAGVYRLISGSSLANTFTTVNGLAGGYVLVYNSLHANELDAQHQADQSISSTSSLRVLAGTTLTGATLGTLNNTAPSGGAALNISLSANDPAGAPATLNITAPSGTLAAASSATITGNIITAGTTTLGSRNFTLSNTDGSALTPTVSTSTGTLDVVTSRTITAASVNFGRVLLGSTATAQSAGLTTSGSHDTTADLTVNNGASGGNANITATSGSAQLFNDATSTGTLSVTNDTALGSTGTQTGTVTLAAGSGNFTGELAGQTLGPITVGYAIDPVNERTFTSPGTLTLGNFLLNATVAVNSNQTITTAGLHDVTTDSTLAAYSGIPSNGLSLTGGPDSITGTNATDSITRTISGTLATGTYYTQSHTFNLNATDELAGPVTNAAGVSYFVNVGNATAALSDRGGTNSADRLAYQMTSTQVGSQTLFNGTVLTAVVGNTGSYAGLASRTMAGGTVLGTVATILDGTNTSGSDRTVTMTWRDRSTLERSGGTTPSRCRRRRVLQRFLISDVVLLDRHGQRLRAQITDTNHSDSRESLHDHHASDGRLCLLQMSHSGGAAPDPGLAGPI